MGDGLQMPQHYSSTQLDADPLVESRDPWLRIKARLYLERRINKYGIGNRQWDGMCSYLFLEIQYPL